MHGQHLLGECGMVITHGAQGMALGAPASEEPIENRCQFLAFQFGVQGKHMIPQAVAGGVGQAEQMLMDIIDGEAVDTMPAATMLSRYRSRISFAFSAVRCLTTSTIDPSNG